MNERPPAPNDEQTTRNIGLAFGLLAEVLDDPDVMTGIPDDATLVLLPYDDPRLTLSNLATAMTLAAKGQTIYLWRVGAPTVDAASMVLPRWPAHWQRQEALTMTLDPDAGELTLDLAHEDVSSPPVRFPIGDRLALLLHADSKEVMGYVIPVRLEEAIGLARHDSDNGPAVTYERGPETPEVYAAFTKDLPLRAA